jgi:hypothetical protein
MTAVRATPLSYTVVSDKAEPPLSAIDFDAVTAKLKAAGLQVSDSPAATTGHGLTTQKPPEKTLLTPGG